MPGEGREPRPVVQTIAIGRRASGRGMAIRATLAAFVWGTIAGPALHLLDHRDDHAHEPGGAIRWARPGAHDHGDGRWHSHGQGTAAGSGAALFPTVAPGGADDHGATGHGAGGASHFATAFLDAPPAALAPAFRAPGRVPGIDPGQVPARRVTRAHPSRGPPFAPLA